MIEPMGLDEKYTRFEIDEESVGYEKPENCGCEKLSQFRKLALVFLGAGGLVLTLVWTNAIGFRGTWLALLLPLSLLGVGSVFFLRDKYEGKSAGIKNDGVLFSDASNRGWIGWVVAISLTVFYVGFYFDLPPGILDGGSRWVEPLSYAMRGQAGDKYFLYSFLYTLAVLVFGVRMLVRYRHNRYQILRTLSVMFFQTAFAFIIPQVLRALEQPEFYPTYFWPLLPDMLFPSKVTDLSAHPGGLGVFMVVWGAVLAFVATPVLTYFYGKRWYCSWVCGCGGLAETLGDPYRHLSDKSTKAWKVERALIYPILVAIVVLTLLLWIYPSSFSLGFRKIYGFVIVSMFAGVIGVGFYPLMGSRVWCRFGCPMAAYLGILQRFFSRFRITTNGAQCISCGNCSTFCEMGIDVRAYAQKGQNIVRASCVGCGVCAAVCPRGVLKLENGSTLADRYEGADQPLNQFWRDLTQPPKA
jgi:Pyruvate/2-oxoacid:ferredoxin oxidoreductase delta subunit